MGTTLSGIKRALIEKNEPNILLATLKLSFNTELGTLTTLSGEHRYGSDGHKWQQILIEIGVYLPSMITHSLSLVKDIFISTILLVAAIGLAIIDLLSGFNEGIHFYTKKVAILFGASLLSMTADTIGVVCPPVGYRVTDFFYSLIRAEFKETYVPHLDQSTPVKNPKPVTQPQSPSRYGYVPYSYTTPVQKTN